MSQKMLPQTTDSSVRLDRIESKLDKLTDAMTMIARVDEKLTAGAARIDRLEYRLDANEAELDDLKEVVVSNTGVSRVIERVFWIACTVIGTIIASASGVS
jgi:DNA repair exonuclease SbcCD ATPase subunit